MKNLIYLFIILFQSQVNAQNGKISYIFSTPKKSFNCELIFNANSSAFFLDVDNELTNEPLDGKEINLNKNQIIVPVADGKKFFIFKDLTNKTMISRELLYNGEKATLYDSIPNLDWIVYNEKKVIGGLICQKATTTFRCANYTAWFTSKVPVQYGPGKMGGLPGLILELTNETAKHIFTLDRIEYPVQGLNLSEMMSINTGDKKYSFGEFAKIQKTELKKMEMFLKAQANNPSDGRFTASIPECFD